MCAVMPITANITAAANAPQTTSALTEQVLRTAFKPFAQALKHAKIRNCLPTFTAAVF